jgi:phage tail sheath protein FI
MALPASPSVVVIENDVSIYTPNVQSSVVGIVGFADKGPTNKAVLVTSQNDLLNKFGKPNSNIPGQGLEGALEILEATNQIYYVRAASTSAAPASTKVLLGFCPAVIVSNPDVPFDTSTLVYTVTDNDGVAQLSKTLTFASSTGKTTARQILKEYFDPALVADQAIVAVENSNSDFYLVGRYAGNLARLSVSANGPLDLSPVSFSGGLHAVTGVSVIASGGTASSIGPSSLYLSVNSKYPGKGYNLSSLRDGTIQGVSVEVESKSIRDELIVNSEGSQRESFLVELSPSSPASIELLLVDDDTNNISDYVYAVVEKDGAALPMKENFADTISTEIAATYRGATVYGTPRFIKMVEGTYGLAGGDSGYSTTNGDGTLSDTSSIIGNQAAKSGIYALDDDFLNISIAIVPGIANQRVQNALITLAESTRNFVAVVAPPFALDNAQEAVDWINGKGTRTSPINNSYATVYWPWIQVFNYFAAADEWYDPAIFAVRQMVFTDNVSEPWFAPAGYRRGRLTKPSDVEVNLNQGDKDLLYSNNINPITKEVQAGITVFGQKTAQRLPTALDRVNVRRLMIFIRKTLLQLGKPFQFEPNDPLTWELVEDAVRPFLDDLLSRRAIVEGDVKCDSTTNTPLRVDRNELWCAVTIKPTKSAETVVFQVNLTNQSATING